MITHTCDECGRVPEYRINRHHEHRDPDVILMLCPDCHNRLHRVRGVPGRARFDATLGLTLAEAGAVVVVAGVDGVDEHEIRRRMPLDRIMARIDHMDRARARLSA